MKTDTVTRDKTDEDSPELISPLGSLSGPCTPPSNENRKSSRDPSFGNSSVGSIYVEPAEPPAPPPGGMLEAVVMNVQSKMNTYMNAHRIEAFSEDESESCCFFMSQNCAISDRIVIFIGDNKGSPAGIWSSALCVRSGHEGGGVNDGGLGSMLPYLTKTKEEKMGMIIFDDIWKDARSYTTLVNRFMLMWNGYVNVSKATHVFIIAYREGGRLVKAVLKSHLPLVKRQLSGIAFIESTHTMRNSDTYGLRKVIAQWGVQWVGHNSPKCSRVKDLEEGAGCICLSAGIKTPEKDILCGCIASIFASFKARWSGFRASVIMSGKERVCYNCKRKFGMRWWRRHCRTCQNAVCEKCSINCTIRHEGQVRLCCICSELPSLVQWSRPRAVRTGEITSVFVDSSTIGKLSVDDFELMQVIGRGACGKVLLVQKKAGRDEGKLYAMKVLKKNWVLNKDLVRQTMAERRILQEANHPFIVQLQYAFQNQDKLYMVMDYYSGGSLRQVLRKRGRFSVNRAKFYLAEIVLAIGHLHASDIIYRDLKLENIVMTAEGHVACTDFGLSKESMSDGERTKSFVGTCEYLAPELIKKDGYGKGVDWWALGILCYEMIQGDSPFRHHVPSMLFEKILTEEPHFTEHFPDEVRDFITRLLTKVPDMRLGNGPTGADEIKNHRFFEGIDFDSILHKTAKVPIPPHRNEDVTDVSHIIRAAAKTRESREEVMPDTPVASNSPSSPKHFDRFSYQGFHDWHSGGLDEKQFRGLDDDIIDEEQELELAFDE